MVGMLQRQRREKGMQLLEKKSFSSVTGALQTTTLQSSVKPDCKVLTGSAEDAGANAYGFLQEVWQWRRLEKLAGSEELFHWKIHGHFSRQWKEKESILCIILYWSQTIKLLLIFLKNIFWNKGEHKIICILPFKLNINLKALTFYIFNF